MLALAAALGVGFALGANAWLSPHDPARGTDGRGARTLVVEGWLNEQGLEQAVAAFRRGRYERIVTTGGPIEPWIDRGGWGDFATRAAAYLRQHVPAGVPVVAVPAPDSAQDRTYLTAVTLRDWAAQSHTELGAIDLYSSGVHARRSRMLYRMALGPRVEVGVLAATPENFDAAHWWTTSAGTKTTLGEALSVAWTACCFWPAAPGSHEERWAVPAAPPVPASAPAPAPQPATVSAPKP